MNTPKQTARNNFTLAALKLAFNERIYRTLLEIWNTDGPAFVKQYVGDSFPCDRREREIARFFPND